jgi:TfoX/Sxy family transcriptional regulator of competence genes
VSNSFGKITTAFEQDRSVTQARMFGSDGLKVGGKVFAMEVKGQLVVKLPRARVEHLLASGKAEPFDPGHGRVMKEWVSISPSNARRWVGLAEEAKAFVSGGR